MVFQDILQIATFITSFEEKYKEDLLQDEVEGWLAWQLLRKEVYHIYKTAYLRKNKSASSTAKPRSILSKLKQVATFLGKLSSIKKNRTLIFSHPIYFLKNDEGQLIDILFQAFLENKKLKPAYISYGEPDHEDSLTIQPDLNLSDAIALYRRFFSKKSTAEIKAVSEKYALLLNEYAKNQNLVVLIKASSIENYLAYFVTLKRFYNFLFKKLQPKNIIVEEKIGSPLLAAALEQDIPSYELQHGVFHYIKPDYYYPLFFKEWKEKMVLPNKVLTFGDLFSEIITDSGFWNKEQVISIGSMKVDPYQRNINKKILATQKRVLLMLEPSRFSVWKEMIEKLVTASEHHYVLKPHPNETEANTLWFKEIANQHPHRFTFYPKATNLMLVMSECNLVAGFHSTALFEAMSIGKPALVFSEDKNKTGFSAFIGKPLLEYFTYLDSFSDFIKTVNTFEIEVEAQAQKGNYFNKLDHYGNVNRFIEQINH